MNNIKISDSEARSISSLFNTNGWQVYMTIIHNARENARDATESAIRDDKMRQSQGASLTLKEICNIETKVRDILHDDNN